MQVTHNVLSTIHLLVTITFFISKIIELEVLLFLAIKNNRKLVQLLLLVTERKTLA